MVRLLSVESRVRWWSNSRNLILISLTLLCPLDWWLRLCCERAIACLDACSQVVSAQIRGYALKKRCQLRAACEWNTSIAITAASSCRPITHSYVMSGPQPRRADQLFFFNLYQHSFHVVYVLLPLSCRRIPTHSYIITSSCICIASEVQSLYCNCDRWAGGFSSQRWLRGTAFKPHQPYSFCYVIIASLRLWGWGEL